MTTILDWIFEGTAGWVASIVASIMDAVSGVFLNALGTDMVTMEEYFPFVATAFSVMKYTAWSLLFIITVWQLFRTFGGPITEAENPWHLLARSALFAILIGYARPIFNIALGIARAPYIALMDVTMSSSSFTFAGIENVLISGLISVVSVITVVGLILQIILMVSLGWNYFKLLLEVVERYIVVGVLCYTSPLAFAVGGSKATNKVFQSWCRMVGSQLLLLIMNVWFLRAFSSSAGHFIANAGALTSGSGNVFLWMFCVLAFLKVAQRFDSYLASIGLSVAQTGSGMGMEMLMGLRLLTGFVGGARSAGSMFGGGAAAGAANTTTSAAGAGGLMAGLAAKFKGNSYVRDAVVDGGARMGAGGSIGFVGRAFGGLAARSGTELTGASISSVASRPATVSGSIGGEIANRSIKNYMPHMSGSAANAASAGVSSTGVVPTTQDSRLNNTTSLTTTPLSGVQYSDTSIAGGHINTTATMADGKTASVDLYSASQFERPDSPHTEVSASDGSQWYQVASGDGMGAFYPTPQFSGDASEASQVEASFSGAADGTTLRTLDDGVIEANNPDSGGSLWLSSAHYQQPDAPHDSITGSDGLVWYAMQPHASVPDFEISQTGAGTYDVSGGHSGISGSTHTDIGDKVDTAHGMSSHAQYEPTSGGLSEAAIDYNRAQFNQFMPGYEQAVSQIDTSRHQDGMLEVRHNDGSGTAFFDRTMYQPPRGDHKVYEDSRGNQWYAIPGTPAVERRPVYADGKAVYDGETLRTANVESVKYRTMLTKFEEPKKRDVNDRKPPNPKKR